MRSLPTCLLAVLSLSWLGGSWPGGVALAQDEPPAASPARPAGPDIDWQAAEAEAAEILSAYLQLDTTNPPGNETLGAQFLAVLLAEEGIDSEIWEYAPGRGSLVARLPSTGEEPPLCLLSHIDVATAEAARWPEETGPLSGVIDEEGRIWGRGALDMKGMGVIELMVLRLAARHDVPLRRDLVLLAVADEEVSNHGIEAVAARWDEIGCSHAINEGGIGIVDMLFEGQTVFPISVGEKGVYWARMVATGDPGHGSVPLPDQAPERMLAAVAALGDRKPKPLFHDSLLELLDNVGDHAGGLPGWILQRPGLVRSLLRARFMNNPLTRATITDTVNVTGFMGAEEPNVVPSEVAANIDARLLPGTTPDALEAELLALVDSEHVRFERIMAREAMVSEWRDDPVYAALARRAVQGRPDAVAGPVLSVGYTDSIALRPLGVRAYGFVPFAVTAKELAGMHGDDEYLRQEELGRGLRVLFDAVMDVAAADAAAADAAAGNTAAGNTAAVDAAPDQGHDGPAAMEDPRAPAP